MSEAIDALGSRIAATDRWTTHDEHLSQATPSYDDDEFFNASSKVNRTNPEASSEIWQATLTILVCSVIIIGTIAGNLLVCAAVAITRKLRTPSNLLIVSLAISDLLVGALDMPFAIMYEVTGRWAIGQTMCDFWTSIDVFFCTASILNLCMISIDRYLVITKPFDYAMKRTPLRMLLMIGLVWIVSAIISIPPLFGWKEEQIPDQCQVSQNKGYQFFATIGAFYLPLIIMIVIYTRIYMVSYRMAATDTRPSFSSSNGRTTGTATNTPTNDTVTVSLFQKPNHHNHHVNHHREVVDGGNGLETVAVVRTNGYLKSGQTPPSPKMRSRMNSTSFSELILRLNCRIRSPRGGGRVHERKATRTLGVIMGAFIACWLPFFILALIKPFCQDQSTCIPPWLNGLFLWLGYANSLLNPIIYARFNREFRTPFKYILQCRCANINSHLRLEDFTEQFGRLQVSRHSSLFPYQTPPVPLASPTSLPQISSNSRKDSFSPSPFPLLPPKPPLRKCSSDNCQNTISRDLTTPPAASPRSLPLPPESLEAETNGPTSLKPISRCPLPLNLVAEADQMNSKYSSELSIPPHHSALHATPPLTSATQLSPNKGQLRTKGALSEVQRLLEVKEVEVGDQSTPNGCITRVVDLSLETEHLP